MVKCAKAALAHDFITSLPKGYDTLVGEGGSKLSGGQKQRITIARALLACPSVLLLDEFSAALDSESECEVQQTLEKLKNEGLTQIIVAHRLCTILHADEIFFLENGRVIGSGTHKELSNKCSQYRKLCQLQKIN